jgi:phage tail-like protein
MSIAPFVLPTITFEVKLPDSVKVGYFTEVTGLSAEVEFQTYNEGGNNEFVHHLPTRVKYPNLVLKRGITDENALLEWFKKTHVGAQRYQVTVTMLDMENKPVRTWSFANAFPVKWTGPSFNAGQSQVATESLEIVHDGLNAH